MARAAFLHGSYATLPPELVDSLNRVYFLHRLATEPEKVVPAGKTLLSMMIHSQMDSGKAAQKQEEALQEQVKEVAHRAFWTEATESLSSPLPSVQLPRLKQLYLDLAETLASLLPPGHRVMQNLRAHLPPTSSPLHSALSFLKELLLALRERCAAIRDEIIDQIYAKLDEWRDVPQQMDLEPSAFLLAGLIVNTIRETVSLAEYMKSDLNATVIGAMSEQDVKGFVLQQAQVRERELVLELWGSNQSPVGQVLRENWRSWSASESNLVEASLGAVDNEKKWIMRLMEQLATNLQISCNFPPSFPQVNSQLAPNRNDTPSNKLPPQFFFVIPKLLHIQNCLQAVTIAASLRSLTRLPLERGNGDLPGYDFMQRIWLLLKMEVDEDASGTSDGIGSTKIINLSDEVIRARRLVSSTGAIDANEESRLRDAVERTLRPRDPVFLLLHRRLSSALAKQVLDTLKINEHTKNPGGGIPETMKTGRAIGENRPRKRVRVELGGTMPNAIHSGSATAPVVVKGFEDPTLVGAISSVFREIYACVTWVETVWGDLVW